VTLLTSEEKAEVIASYVDFGGPRRNLIETGTGYGLIPNTLHATFDYIASIEVDPRLAAEARALCRRWFNVRIITGHSEDYLPDVLTSRSIIFLDAHENTLPENEARSALASELAVIGDAPYCENLVVLIDDARLCRDDHGWVSLEGIRAWAAHHGLMYELEDDIVRLTP